MICMNSALNYTDGHQFDFNSNHTSSTQYNATGGTGTTNLPDTPCTYDLGGTMDSALTKGAAPFYIHMLYGVNGAWHSVGWQLRTRLPAPPNLAPS